MTPDEIWLRLMKVNNLYGDRMLDIAQRLCAAAFVDSESLTRRSAGWNTRIIICYGLTIRAIRCG